MYICVRNIDVVSVPCEWKEQRLHRYSWQTYTWPLTRNRDNIDIPDRHIYTWPLTRNRDYIDIPDIHIHDHSQGTETTSIFVSVPCEWSCICVSGISMLSLFLVSGIVYMCQEYRCSLCSLWVVMYICVRNIDVVSVPCEWSDNIDIPVTYIHDHSQGTKTTSIFLTHIYMTTHKEQRLHRYSWHIYTWPLTRNRDNIDIPDTSMLSLFLVSGHVYVCQEYRCCLCSLWVVMYICVRNIDVVSVPWHIYTWPLTRNRDNIYIPDRHIHDHSQGTKTTSIFLTHIYMTTHKEQRQHLYSRQTYTCGHVYVCQEYRCCLCSLWVVMYICLSGI
jgi:hypothetical protein